MLPRRQAVPSTVALGNSVPTFTQTGRLHMSSCHVAYRPMPLVLQLRLRTIDRNRQPIPGLISALLLSPPFLLHANLFSCCVAQHLEREKKKSKAHLMQVSTVGHSTQMVRGCLISRRPPLVSFVPCFPCTYGSVFFFFPGANPLNLVLLFTPRPAALLPFMIS